MTSFNPLFYSSSMLKVTQQIEMNLRDCMLPLRLETIPNTLQTLMTYSGWAGHSMIAATTTIQLLMDRARALVMMPLGKIYKHPSDEILHCFFDSWGLEFFQFISRLTTYLDY
jgi:hypothetical protein